MQFTAIAAFALASLRMAILLDNNAPRLDAWRDTVVPGLFLLTASSLLFLPASAAGLSRASIGKCALWLTIHWLILSIASALYAVFDGSILVGVFVLWIASVSFLILFGGFFIISILCVSGFYVYRPGRGSLAQNEIVRVEEGAIE